MAASIETRVPFLDHELVEFAFTIPTEVKIKNLIPKYILKKILENKLPSEIVNAKKKGFAIPIAKWFRKDWFGYLISELDRNNNQLYDFFDKRAILKIINDHKSGKIDYSEKLWSILFLSKWLEKQKA